LDAGFFSGVMKRCWPRCRKRNTSRDRPLRQCLCRALRGFPAHASHRPGSRRGSRRAPGRWQSTKIAGWELSPARSCRRRVILLAASSKQGKFPPTLAGLPWRGTSFRDLRFQCPGSAQKNPRSARVAILAGAGASDFRRLSFSISTTRVFSTISVPRGRDRLA